MNKKNRKTHVNKSSKNSKFQLLKPEVNDPPNILKKELSELESLLHLLMVRMNHLQGIEFDFNLIFKYHKLKLMIKSTNINEFEKIKAIMDQTTEFENKYKFMKDFYLIIHEFLTLIRDLTIYFDLLEKNCFDYKSELKNDKEKILNHFLLEHFEENNFHFNTFYISSKSYDKNIKLTQGTLEKALILQNKLLHVLRSFYDYYPLSNSNKELDKYYNILFVNFKKEEIKLSNEDQYVRNVSEIPDTLNSKKNDDSVQQSNKFISYICKFCKKSPSPNLNELNQYIKPLMSLDFTISNNKITQLLKNMVIEFTRIYLKVEELIYIEICKF